MDDPAGVVDANWPTWGTDDGPIAGGSGDPALWQVVHDFLVTEAALLDDDRLEEWLELFAEDSLYWLPLTRHAEDPSAQLNLIFDDRRLLGDRVFRIRSGDAHTQDPPSELIRSVSSVRARRAGPDLLEARSVVALTEVRRGSVSSYAARCTHVLRDEDRGLRIVRKRVDLATASGVLPSLTFLF